LASHKNGFVQYEKLRLRNCFDDMGVSVTHRCASAVELVAKYFYTEQDISVICPITA